MRAQPRTPLVRHGPTDIEIEEARSVQHFDDGGAAEAGASRRPPNQRTRRLGTFGVRSTAGPGPSYMFAVPPTMNSSST